MASDKAIYEKYVRGLENSDRLKVKIPLENFYHEARDIPHHSVVMFFKSTVFSS